MGSEVKGVGRTQSQGPPLGDAQAGVWCKSVTVPHQLQHEGEDVDDVSVDLQGTRDVVLWADGVFPVAQNQLRVVRQELQAQGEA